MAGCFMVKPMGQGWLCLRTMPYILSIDEIFFKRSLTGTLAKDPQVQFTPEAVALMALSS